MLKLIKPIMIAMAVPTFAVTFPATASAEEIECPFDEFNENRRGIIGCYHSEISPAEAFAETVAIGKWSDRSRKAVLLDVRSTPEYKAGHPQRSYNVPYPFIYQECLEYYKDDEGNLDLDDPVEPPLRRPDGACKSGGERISQPAEDFVAYVESIVPDKNTPIFTMCRTGVRSVGAAEVLTLAGYKEVRNIWEGFVGINLTAPNQVDPTVTNPDGVGPVDLNHDGELTDEDKNGWRYHQGLPYETRLLPSLMWMGDYSDTYYWD